MTERLYRSTTDRMLTGVAGGLAAYLGVDSSIVRVAWIVIALLTGGIAALVYLVMIFVVPEAPPGWSGRRPGAAGPGPGVVPGWQAPGTPEGQEPGAVPGWQEAGAPEWQSPPTAEWQSPPPARQPRAPSNAPMVFGVVLILLGAWFLFSRYLHIAGDVVWPIVVMGLGALLIAQAVRRRD